MVNSNLYSKPYVGDYVLLYDEMVALRKGYGGPD